VGGLIITITAFDVLKNISNNFPQIMRLVTAVAYVSGFVLIFKGIFALKHMGESRTMMSREHGVMGPIIQLVIGAALIYLPSTIRVGMSTFWTEPHPFAYPEPSSGQWAQVTLVCFSAVQLFGMIAVIRGLLMMGSTSGHRGGQASLGRGLTHFIGGIFCLNIYQFIQVVMGTIGVSY